MVKLGIISSNKETDVQYIKSGDNFKVKISLSAEPEILNKPAEIVLLLDKSKSMVGESFENMKYGAETFIDFLDEATDGAVDKSLNKTNVAIISFSDYADVDIGLTNDVSTIKEAFKKIQIGQNTNHFAAFSKAFELLNHETKKDKIIVMVTDGQTTIGPDASDMVDTIKKSGIKIYCMGINNKNNNSVNKDVLRKWCSDPDKNYFYLAINEKYIVKKLEEIAVDISKPGAKNVIIDEKVNSDFSITEVIAPEKGSALITGFDSIKWKIDSLGNKNAEEAVLEFTVKHLGKNTGKLAVNKSIHYTDIYGNKVNFPSPEIFIDGNVEYLPEECPSPVEIEIDCCKDSFEYDIGEMNMESLGRILQLDLTLKNICPEKRVALAVILSEVDSEGAEHKRGLKTAVIPAHHQQMCKDIKIKCMKFVLPEELDVSGGCPYSLCNKRHFKARVIFHYIDHDFECCDIVI